MDVYEEMIYSEAALDVLQESAERYVRMYADPKRVGVNVRSKLGPGEPYFIYPAKNSNFAFKEVPRFISRSQLDRLEDGCGRVYGRSENGIFCEIVVFNYLILAVTLIPEHGQEEVRKIVYEE